MNPSGYDPSQLLPNDQSSQTSSVNPSGVPLAPDPPHSAEPSQIHFQNQQLNPVQGAPVVPGSLNPAALAVVAGALSQLTNYVGNVGGVPGAVPETFGPTQYRGRGRRGGRPFRRGGFNHRGRSPYRGRGRGRGGDARSLLPSFEPAISNLADAPAADGTTSVVQPSSLVSGQIPLPNLAPVPPALLQPPPCKFWCEICKAECNSAEIFEKHNNGKRHKKNLLVHEELQRLKAINGQQSGNIPTSQFDSTIHPENAHESEKNGLPEENMGSETTDSYQNHETELQNNIVGVSKVQGENPVEPQDNSALQMGEGRGGKYMKIDDGSRKPVEPPITRVTFPFICELCNAKCESQVVYNSHVTGKKHLSNLNRVYHRQSGFGEAGRQPLQPPDINTLSNSNNYQVHQGVNDAQTLLGQLLMTVLSQVQLPATVPSADTEVAQTQAPTSVAGSNHELVTQVLSQTQVSESLAHAVAESENPTGEQLVAAATGSSNDTETADGRSATEENPPAENPVAANEQVPLYFEAPTFQ